MLPARDGSGHEDGERAALDVGVGGPLAVVASRIRLEERLILEALERRRVPHELVDARRLCVRLDGPELPYSGALGREISHTRSLYVARLLEFAGIPVVNAADVVSLCGDKLLTTLRLREAGLPTPRTLVAFGLETALDGLGELGYPCVIKPVVGSWGRLGARVRDREGAEQILEHRLALPGPQHGVVYAQEYVRKPDRDIKAFVLGDEVVAAIYRTSSEWRTNTARGGVPTPCPLTDELVSLVRAAARAIGGGVLSIDVLEGPEGELYVNEVNHTPEFHGTRLVTDADLAGRYVDYVVGRLGLTTKQLRAVNKRSAIV
jgi:[lysine-biosynthesis-protein LysW]--L-2-aminoadipate ligase